MTNDANKEQCERSDLSHLGLIRVSGEDARTLLQGQLTNDINLVTAQQSQLSAICNPKGRVFSSFLIFERDDALYLQLQRSVLEPVLKRLSMFVLMSKVSITDASNDLVCIGITGECVSQIAVDIPVGDFNSIIQNQVTCIRHPGDSPRIQLIGTAADIELYQKQLADTTTADVNTWSLADIRSGIPSVHAETMELFIPQMLNMDLIDGVNFKKGCFTGQEVVARMHYLGKSKRRMYVAKIMAGQVPLPGSKLFSPSSKSGQSHGDVVDARPVADGNYEALVVTQTSSMTSQDLLLGDESGPAVIIAEPPYSLET